VCNATQTGFDLKATCAPQEICDPVKQKCLACTMGQYRCNPSTPDVLERCRADGTGFDMVKKCAASSQCSATAGDCVGASDAGTSDARSD